MTRSDRCVEHIKSVGDGSADGGYLGINYNGMHDSSVAFIDADGTLRYAASEERFSRVKGDGRFPYAALANTPRDDVAAIGVPYLWTPPSPMTSDPIFARLLAPADRRPVESMPQSWLDRLRELGRPLMFFDHHQIHAYTGYVLSGYPEALAFTADYGAPGCPITMGIYHLTRGAIATLGAASHHDRIALAGMYSDVTAILGFTVARHEGKVTGLAAYGRRSDACRRAVWELHRAIQASDVPMYDWTNVLSRDASPAMESNRYLVEHFRAQLPFTDADIARAAQDLLEEKLVEIVRWLADRYGRQLPLILSGGVFANVRANLELAKVGFARLFVAPPMGDDGLSIGAAAAARDRLTEETFAVDDAAALPATPPRRPTSMMLGPGPGDEIDELLLGLGIQYQRPPDREAIHQLADALHHGQTVALVRGPQEFGPRALGHRSILAGADDPTLNARLNARLERTEFMPFAPVLRADRVADTLSLDALPTDITDCLPFMTMCLPVSDWAAKLAPAVVHIDGTARPQIVSEADDPLLFELLGAYETRSGIPLLINTSFNIHDQPLVSSARDALIGFLRAGLDVLYLEGRVIALADNVRLHELARLMADPTGQQYKARLHGLSYSLGRLLATSPGRYSDAFA